VARLFGTDGIRGVANKPPMTAETGLAVGRALVQFCRERGVERPVVVLGRDTRRSGVMLEAAVAAGLCSAGADVVKVDMLPTPGVAFAVREIEAAAGVVISASHNPFEDNGIKIFASGGVKLSDADEDRIEALMAESAATGGPSGPEIGTAESSASLELSYMEFCVGTYPGEDLKGLSVVLDCANGATFNVAPQVFSALGAQVSVINDSPDGLNINQGCGSEHSEGLSEKVRQLGADVGLAFDGDGDRVIAVDESGRRLTGDQLITICAQMYKERGWLDNDVVVTTVMSNMGLKRALEGIGVRHVATQVGDRQVVEAMRDLQGVIGGEESGHIVIRRHHTTGDGIIAGLQVLGAIKFYGRRLSDLAGMMTVFPQKTLNVDVTCKPPIEEIPSLVEAIKTAEAALGGSGRILVRYSGTQSMCRVMVEGPDDEQICELADRLAGLIQDGIGAA